MEIEKNLAHTAFLQREHDFKHTSYNEELNIMDIVLNGEVHRIKELKRAFLSKGSGILSQDPLRNARYMFVACITLITRLAIEGGMIETEAYNLSDVYIQKMDLCSSVSEIRTLYGNAAYDFTKQVQDIQLSHAYSKPILIALDYIYEHLHCSISVDDVADAVNLSTSYFSFLFKKELGISVAAYIRNMRIKAAKRMLLFSDYSYQEISNYLAFSSQSHFISMFKKQVGMTPKEYRMTQYSLGWQRK